MPAEASLQSHTVVQRAPNITFEPFDDEWLAIDGASGYCYSLNQTAGQVWAHLETPAAVQVVAQKVCARYAVDPAACQADVLALVQQLLEYRLVQVVQP